MDTPQARYQPLSLPNQTVHAVRLNNLLLNKTVGYGIQLADGKAFRFRMTTGDIQTQQRCPISLTLELGNTTAGLWLTEWPLQDRINQFVPDSMLKTLPENLAISVIENALAPLLLQAEQGLDLKLGIQSMSAGMRSPLYSMPFGFEMQIAAMPENTVLYQGTGLLLLDPQLYPHLQQRLSLWPSDSNADWEEHHTPLRMEISRSILTMQDINQLQPEDLILLEDTRFQQHGTINLCLDSGYCCEATFTSPAKTALSINTGWTPMSDNEQKQSIEHISQIPVQLSFDLGQKTLSFNEVRQLRPGYIIELGMTLPEVVQIRSQNRQIGTGELVEINGRIGVRILNLFNKKAKGS
ncbi:FliM/FliN family flagellar motor switch protein [Thiothrix unzii]|jgi:type III secretion system YscQ/HrcQ family protein|uniref:FliM/FliN family flagellar motor switch protein n=1 Tax=Thiothrix unzii TaxID=111769 RepID=UPI002A35EFC1|nr:FliM/FliN family flagellar motor switch protein [Thiothrix unzii]MDX9990343.1 FliM/FliN family flagellar motor switch protein [Thiothrix unzii]